jgi:hypothetical protein
LIPDDRRIRIDSAATAVWCLQRTEGTRKNKPKGLSLQHLLRYADERECLTGLLLGTYYWCIATNHLGCKHFADDKEVEKDLRKRLRQHSKDFYAVG